MKLIKCLLISATLAGGFIGCSEYDDAWIKEAIEDLKDRVTTLEDWCKTANSNISALQTLVTALEKNDYITGVVPVTENGKEIGYTISFKNSPSIIVYHGKDGQDGTDGKDGVSPVISIAKGSDGLYYWTQKIGDADPAFILDEKGNKLPASGTSTSTVTAPRLSVDAEGYWMIDVDGKGAVRMKDANGKDVKATGPQGPQGPSGSQGPAGDSIFKSIDDSNPDYVIITLKDGTKLALAKFPVIWVTAGNAEKEIEEAIGKAEMNKSEELYLGGTLSAADYTKLKTLTALKTLDLSYITDKELPASAFKDNTTIEKIVLPKALTKINRIAFSGCTALTTVEIPATVVEIGEWAFENCENLISITLPSGLKKLNNGILGGCTQLASITIPQEVTEIGDWAFQLCDGLTSVIIPAKVVSVGQGIFYNCPKLTTLRIDADLTKIPEDMCYNCQELTTINLPPNITSIGNDAFNICKKISGALTIPSKVESIGRRAFSFASITSLVLPEGLKEIHQAAFANISGMTEIVLPAGLKKLSDSGFNWSKVQKITFNNTAAPEVIYTVDRDENLQKPDVSSIKDCNVYVPASAVDAYKASVWGTGSDSYGSHIDYFTPDKIQAIIP